MNAESLTGRAVACFWCCFPMPLSITPAAWTPTFVYSSQICFTFIFHALNTLGKQVCFNKILEEIRNKESIHVIKVLYKIKVCIVKCLYK